MSHLISDHFGIGEGVIDLKEGFRFAVAFDEGGDNGGGEGGGNDTGSANSSEGGDQNGTDSSGEGSENGNGEIRDPEKKKLSDEAARYRNSAKEANDKLAEALNRLKEFEDKDKSVLEKAERDRDEFKATSEQLADENAKLKVQLGLYQSGALNSFNNASDAETFLDVAALVNDEGAVDTKKVTEAIEALKKDRPYLFKATDEDSGTNPPSGSRPPARKTGAKGANDEALRKKFPALQGR